MFTEGNGLYLMDIDARALEETLFLANNIF